MTGHWETAQDIAQEAFARLAAQTRTLQGPEADRRWLFVVARNLSFNYLRGLRQEAGAKPGTEPSPIATPEELESQSETAALVAQAVYALPDEFREVIVLREYESMSYAEIADVTGVALGTVKSRIARARGMLLESLANLLENER